MYDAGDEEVARRHRLREIAGALRSLSKKCDDMGERDEGTRFAQQAEEMEHRAAKDTPLLELKNSRLRIYSEGYEGHATDLYFYDENNALVFSLSSGDFAKTAKLRSPIFDALVALLEGMI